MPDFQLSGPDGQRLKLTVPEGVSQADIEAVFADQGLPGEPQRRSRADILTEGADQLKEALAPSYLKDTPPTPESNQALADPAGQPRKIGPPSGPPTAMQMAGGLAGDVATGLVPEGKALGVLGGAAGRFTSPRQIRSRLDELNELVRAGRMTPDELGAARVRMGLPREAPGYAAPRPINRSTLDELSAIRDMPTEEQMVARAVRGPGSGATPRPILPQRASPLGGDEGVQEFFAEHIAPHFGGDERAFVQSYFNGHYSERFDVGMGADGGLYMKGPLRSEGRSIGDITRIIYPDRAAHDYLHIMDRARGSGFVKQLTANQIGLYRKMGIDQVDLLANVDVGAYAWAKYGWLPDQGEWSRYSHALGTRLRLLSRHLEPAVRDDIQAYLNNPDPRSIWWISDFRQPWQHPDWDRRINTIGKAMLSGQEWEGTLHLNNPQQMERFNHYVGQ